MPSKSKKPRHVTEFGDFQTPADLAARACSAIAATGFSPHSVVEPTCGTGNFLLAALEQFPTVRKALALDINAEYVEATRRQLHASPFASKATILCDNFFTTDWPAQLHALPEPMLVVGNPPWVTNAELGSLRSSNLPEKNNFQGHAGFAAMTGKSNFDISEWMLIRLVEWLQGKRATLAMLCKTAVARKVLSHAWRTSLRINRADVYLIDAAEHFSASVDACFLVCRINGNALAADCSLHPTLETTIPSQVLGFRDGQLVANVTYYERWKHLQGQPHCEWRSGVKHDCSAIMELRKLQPGYENGLGEVLNIEDAFLYPMLKSSGLANGDLKSPPRYMLVTQSTVGEDTARIAESAPKTWLYLQRHARLLDRRASSIYRKRPRFSVFGVGPYTFAPWKVAISGFYKTLAFKVVGSVHGKPVILDDTANFIPCRTKAEAEYLASLLNSVPAREFFQSFIFWDNKRPITVELLRRLDMLALARELGTEQEASAYLDVEPANRKKRQPRNCQQELFAADL